MKIKTKLHVSTLFTLMMIVVVPLIFYGAQLKTGQLEETRKSNRIMIKGVSELKSVTLDYLLHGDERSKAQWYARFESLKKLADERISIDPKNMESLNKVREDLDAIRGVFVQLEKVYDRPHSPGQGNAAKDIENMLVSQMMIRTDVIIAETFNLQDSSSEETLADQQRANLLVIAFLGIFALSMAANTFLLRRSILSPLLRLREGSEVIAGGDLAYRLGTSGDDEIGDLSRAFDEMTVQLQRSYGDLTKEVTERGRAEDALQKLNDELEIRVAQRTEELEENRNQLEERAEELMQSLNSKEEEIAERQMSEERLRLLIDGTKDYAIFMLDIDGSVISWNEGAGRLKGWDEQEILGRHFSLFYTEEDMAAGQPEHGLSLATTEGHFEEVGWRVRKDGSKFMADVVITALRDDSGRLRGFSKVTHDITERLRAMETLHEKEQMLIQQSRQAAMGEMISNIAHQWRQPLNTLGLSIQQLKLYYEIGEFTEEFLDQSVTSSMDLIQHMSKTIDDFRDYFRPDKEKLEFNIREVVESTLSLIEDSFKSKNIGVVIVANGDPAIHGFRNEFAQVLLNIFNNAGDVLVGRDCTDCKITITFGSEDDRTVVSVADNAGGIPEEIISKIFDPYFTTKGPQQGTGLGLYMSKAIIEKNMGGKLTVQNIADGAEFRLEVPKWNP